MRPVEISVSVFGVLVSYSCRHREEWERKKKQISSTPNYLRFAIPSITISWPVWSPLNADQFPAVLLFSGHTEPTRAPAILLTVRGGGERSGGPTAATGVSCLGEGAAATGGEQGGGGDSCRGEGAATDAGDFDDTPPTRAPGTCGSSTPNTILFYHHGFGRVSSFLLKHRHCVSWGFISMVSDAWRIRFLSS
jgi:hypothetical protein